MNEDGAALIGAGSRPLWDVCRLVSTASLSFPGHENVAQAA